jgi:NhaP-type Na+/H+ or K+/H+ antiporter
VLSRIASDPSVTIALALFVGMLIHVLSEHLKVPSIILLLAAGILLGPDGAGIIQPSTLGVSLHHLVGFGVAVILFEGAMNLRLTQLRRESRSIRHLTTLGVVVSAIGCTLAPYFILGWEMPLAILFGTLMTVTGPTVITPLVRRMRLQSRIATVLQAEGIFVDAIGAILAVVTLEFVIARDSGSLMAGATNAILRLVAGIVFGAIGGGVIVGLLRPERLIPEALQRAFTLAFVLALFQISNAVTSESGIVAVIVAGLVAGNARVHGLIELREFKEQITVLLLGLLFVLLSADVGLAEIGELGWPGVAVVVVVMLVVRPLNVWVATRRTDLTTREKLFLAAMAPRGIVAAAVGSLFAQTLDAEGIAGGAELRALVFLTITITVIVAGTVGTTAAHLLGLVRPLSRGLVILGAQPVGRLLAKVLGSLGDDVILIDSNPQLCRAAENEGLRIIYGSGLSEYILQRADLETRQGCIAATTNDEVNLLFARRARKTYKVPRAWVAIRSGHLNVTPDMVRQLDSRLLFGMPRKLDTWNLRMERGQTELSRWLYAGQSRRITDDRMPDDVLAYVPLSVERGRSIMPVDEETTFRANDTLHALVWSERARDAEAQLNSAGFQRIEERVPEQPLATVK